MGSYATGEITLAKEVVPQLKPGMLCLADRFFFGFKLWTKAQASGCDLLWRVRKHLRLEVHERLSDGSYLSAIYPSEKDARHKTKGVRVRVIDYQLQGIRDAEPIYRLVTTILDPLRAPAAELAALYHERWEIENTFESSTWCTPSDAMEFQEPIALNRPLVGAPDGSVRPCIARRLLCAESMVHPRRLASPATVSAESVARQWSA
jgi:Transposase DDE domain